MVRAACTLVLVVVGGGWAADPAVEIDGLRKDAAAAQRAGQFARAEALLKDALALSDQLPAESQYRATVWNDVGMMHHEGCRPDEAERWYKKTLAVFEKGGDPAPLETVLTNLAFLYLETGKASRAAEMLKRMEPLATGDAVSNYRRMRLETVRGRVAAAAGRMDEAEEAIRRAQKAAELDGDMSSLSAQYHDFGLLCLRRNDPDRAAAAFERARQLIEASEGARSPRMIGVLFRKAAAESRGKHHDDAVQDSARALQLSRSMFPADSPALAVAYQVHGDLLTKAGRKKEGKAAEKEGARILALHGRESVVDSSTVDLLALRQGR